MISPYFHMAGDEARGLLYGLVESDKIQLRKYPKMPSMRKLILEGKVKYRQADPNEHWQTYKEIVDQVEDEGVGYADCEDLATALSAEDQVRYGTHSLPYAYSPKPGLFHVVTAVPKGSYGAIPGSWPSARGASDVPGYILQDPSAAAGMGKDFADGPSGGAPGMSLFGALPASSSPAKRKGLGAILGAFQRGLIADETAASAAYQLGSGAREGTGVEGGWAQKLGEGLGSRFSPVAPVAPEKSSAQQAQEAMDEDVDLDDIEEEFGAIAKKGLGGLIGAFRKGLIGNDTLVSAAHRLGEGARKGSGIQGGWARKLGEGLGGRMGPASRADTEAPSVASASASGEDEEDEEDLDDDEDLDDFEDEDEEFGLFGRMWFEDDPDLYPEDDVTDGDEAAAMFGVEAEDFVGGRPWNLDRLANLVADDLHGKGYGALHLGDQIEGEYQMGVFQRYMEEPTDFSHEDLRPNPAPRFGLLSEETQAAMNQAHGMAALMAANLLKEAGFLEARETPSVSGYHSMSLKTRPLVRGEHGVVDDLASAAASKFPGVILFWNPPESRRYLTFTTNLGRDFSRLKVNQIYPVRQDVFVEASHDELTHLQPPSHMHPPAHMKNPEVQTRPMVTSSVDEDESEDEDFGFDRSDLFGLDYDLHDDDDDLDELDLGIDYSDILEGL